MRKYFIIRGGLGNQLFQIGGALKISENVLDIVLVDACNYFDQNRNFICQGIFSNFNIKVIRYNYYWRVLMFIMRRCSVLRQVFKVYIEEKNDSLSLLDSGRIFEGYFQSQDSVEALLAAVDRKTLAVKDIDFGQKRLVSGDGKVMVHVRRGDYRLYKDIYEILDLTYYEMALERATKFMNVKSVYIYSSEEVCDVVKIFEKFPTQFRSCQFSDDVCEFMEMLGSEIFIIANSSFSFWAAVLSKNSSKVIIMPKSYLTGFNAACVVRI